MSPEEESSTSTARPVWHSAMNLVVAVYDVAKRLPPNERYVLSPQLRRAAISVAANVTEGYARLGQRQLRAFLDIALGSARECDLLLHVAVRVGSINAADIELALHAAESVSRQLYAILRGLRTSERRLSNGSTRASSTARPP